MPPTNVKEFYEEQRDALDLAQAQTDFQDAQEANRQAEDARVAAVQAVVDLEQAIEATRTAAAAAGMPSEVEALADDLHVLLVQHRNARADLLVKQDAAHEADRALAKAADVVEATEAEAATLDEILSEESQRRERIDDWNVQIGESPLQDAPASAAGHLAETLTADEEALLADLEAADAEELTTLLDLKPFASALFRIDSGFPETLRTRARERIVYERSRRERRAAAVAAATTVAAEFAEETDGPEAEASNAAQALAVAEADLGDFVLRAEERLEQTRSTLLELVEREGLADDVADQVNGVIDPDLVTDGTAGAGAEKTYQDAVEALEAAQAELDLEELELLAADVDVDLEADGDRQTLVAARDAAAAAVTAAEPTANQRADLDSWEAAVPDGHWNGLTRLEKLRETLESLSAVTPADLASAVDSAEAALLAALQELDKSERTEIFVETALADASDAASYFLETFDQRVAGAARGDAA